MNGSEILSLYRNICLKLLFVLIDYPQNLTNADFLGQGNLNMVSEKSGKSQGILLSIVCGNPEGGCTYLKFYLHLHLHPRERSGSVVECLTRDRRAAGLSLTGVTALCP